MLFVPSKDNKILVLEMQQLLLRQIFNRFQ